MLKILQSAKAYRQTFFTIICSSSSQNVTMNTTGIFPSTLKCAEIKPVFKRKIHEIRKIIRSPFVNKIR